MTDWTALLGNTPQQRIKGTLLRIVESQEHVATWSLVNSLEDQQLLEEMIESSKPALSNAARGLHYLLATPFRYPPLKHGSRFGQRHEPGIFYGAKSVRTLLCEFAYYRFVFWSAMSTPPEGPVLSQHTEFAASYSVSGYRLQHPPFSSHRDVLRSQSSYQDTHALGHAMRETGTEGFEYESARDPDAGINIGLFKPQALISKTPRQQRAWLCETGNDFIVLSQAGKDRTWLFSREDFELNGMLPLPSP